MERFFKAIDYIEANLDGAVSLSDVAAAACYSDYHFCRMFRGIVGDTVAGYVRKRRLSIAAERLLAEDIRLIDLALESGFESQEAFTRAFKRLFGLSPGAFRRRCAPVRFRHRPAFTPDLLDHLRKGMTMEPSIVNRPAFKVIGLLDEFTEESTTDIPALWQRLNGRAGEIPNRICGPAFGLCFKHSEPGRINYLAGLEVSSLDQVPDGMAGREVAEQTYAVFTHKMTSPDIPKDIRKTMQYIWGTWLPNADYDYAETPDFELYDERFDPVNMTGEFDIYIPVRSKG